MLHDCRMHPDLQHAFLSNHCFPVPCFDENTTTEELCRAVQLEQVLMHRVLLRTLTPACFRLAP